MFNREYEFNLNQTTNLLQFPHGEGVICETPLGTDLPHEVGPFWEQLTGNQTYNFEGNNATQIHNPTIHYFLQMLAHTIFGRENKSRINAKELFYILYVFEHTRVNSYPFLLAHMQAVRTAKKGHIIFGGLITSIARALNLHAELATLDPLPMFSLDIDVCLHMRLMKNKSDERFSLVIANMVVPSIILPCMNRTDVRVRANWTYNLNLGVEVGQVPMDIHENVAADGDIDDEFDQRERGSPVHQSPPHHSPHIPASHAPTTHFSDHFPGTSFGSTHVTLDDILNEMRARNAIDVERDNLIYAMHQQ